MTPERLVVDTDIAIDLLKKRPSTVALFMVLLESETRFLISPIVVAEVFAGAFPREYKDIEAFFSLCAHIDLDGETGRAVGLYANQCRKAYQGISLEDFLLAAAAKTHRCALWTGNHKHCPMPDIELFGG